MIGGGSRFCILGDTLAGFGELLLYSMLRLNLSSPAFIAMVCWSAISVSTLVYCGASFEMSFASLGCKTGVSIRCSIATEVSRDVGKI